METIDNDLRGVVKALSDVVQPALDPADPLAGEQLRLAISYLDFLRSRLDFTGSRRRFELRDNLELAKALARLKEGLSAVLYEALELAVFEGEQLLASSMEDAEEARSAAAKLAAAIRLIVRESATGPAEFRDAVEKTVLNRSEERIMFERAWFLPVGGDRQPEEVRPLPDFVQGASA